MKKILPLLVSVLLCGGCQQTGNTEKHQKSRQEIIDVRDEIQEINLGNLLVGAIAKLYPINEYIIILDVRSSDKLLHILDKKDLKHVCSGVKKGRGPGEVVNIGSLLIDADHRHFFVLDHGKQSIFDYELDKFIADSAYMPNAIMELNKSQFPSNSQYISDTMLLGVMIEPIGTSSFKQSMAKWSMTGEDMVPMPYEHPDIEKRRISFAASPRYGLYVETYRHHDLMTICSLEGELKYNIYGPKWDATTSKAIAYYSKPLFCRDKIVISYSGEDNNTDDYYPTKFMIFDVNGDYIKTLETGYKISDFCYDEENNRLVMSLDDVIQFATLNLDGII